MSNCSRDPNRGDCLSPTSPQLLANPLDFIHEDHLRERQVCTMLDRIAAVDQPDLNEIRQVLEFLRDGLPRPLEDEEQDLFPRLRRRCEREDEIGKVIERLRSDHRHAHEDTPLVIADLEAIDRREGELSHQVRARLARFAGHARRHLTLENAIVLPFAKLRLTRGDLESLRLRMMQRRGLDRVMEPDHAQ